MRHHLPLKTSLSLRDLLSQRQRHHTTNQLRAPRTRRRNHQRTQPQHLPHQRRLQAHPHTKRFRKCPIPLRLKVLARQHQTRRPSQRGPSFQHLHQPARGGNYPIKRPFSFTLPFKDIHHAQEEGRFTKGLLYFILSGLRKGFSGRRLHINFSLSQRLIHPNSTRTITQSRLLTHHLSTTFSRRSMNTITTNVRTMFSRAVLIRIRHVRPDILVRPSRVLTTTTFKHRSRVQGITLNKHRLSLVMTKHIILHINRRPCLRRLSQLNLTNIRLTIHSTHTNQRRLGLSQARSFRITRTITIPRHTFRHSQRSLRIIIQVNSRALTQDRNIIIRRPRNTRVRPTKVMVIYGARHVIDLRPAIINVATQLNTIGHLIRGKVF